MENLQTQLQHSQSRYMCDKMTVVCCCVFCSHWQERGEHVSLQWPSELDHLLLGELKSSQGSKFMTKWLHMWSKFTGCDSIVNAIRIVRIQKLLLVRLLFNCATNHACEKIQQCTHAWSHLCFLPLRAWIPLSTIPDYKSSTAGRHIYLKPRVHSSAASYICFPR
jgi:hypothetical protein